MAHFASLRLQYLADKVKYIDHLLYDDTDSQGKQKRMMTLVPWIVCLDELKTTKASKLEDERILQPEIFKYIKDNKWCRFQLDACKNPPYPDLPEFHAAFKNFTYPHPPAPPTDPQPPFSAFCPKPANWWLPLLPLTPCSPNPLVLSPLDPVISDPMTQIPLG